jgi:choline dehydrogenase
MEVEGGDRHGSGAGAWNFPHVHTLNEEDTEEAEYSSNYTGDLMYSPFQKQRTNASKNANKRRWSVMEKLEQRHYCRIRSCADCGRILNCKCLLATCMLGIFVVLAVAFAHVLFFATEVGSVRFDYIVIGAGPAGSLLANRLVRDGATVLLLESGNFTQYEVEGEDYFAGPVSRFDVPFLWPVMPQFPDFRWRNGGVDGAKEDDSDNAAGNSEVIQAKGVGGNGIYSNMIYMRALPTDIMRWGSQQWTWGKVLELYQGLEQFIDSAAASAAAAAAAAAAAEDVHKDYAGVHGVCDTESEIGCKERRIVTALPEMVDVMSSAFLSAAKAVGIGHSADFNDHRKKREGAGLYHFNIADGVRDSSARRFLKPILSEPGLVLETEASCTQILMNADVSLNATYPSLAGDPAAYRAIGVEFMQRGELKRAFLRNAMIPESLQTQFDATSRGVIVAAGALGTPKILMKSGIGSAEELKLAGVEPKVLSEGVGKGLKDHPTVAVIVEVDSHFAASQPSSFNFMSALPPYMEAVTAARDSHKHHGGSGSDYYSTADFGILGSPGMSAGAFLRSPHHSPSGTDTGPDIQLSVYPFVPDPFKNAMSAGAQRRRRKRSTSSVSENEGAFLSITVSLLHPETTMVVHLNSSQGYDDLNSLPLVAPSVTAGHGDGNVFGQLAAQDASRLQWGIEEARRILAAEALASHIVEEAYPGDHVKEDDGSLLSWTARNAIPAGNWCGSARLGAVSDRLAVLDEQLRVKGVQDLRVADSSALPDITSGNLQATVLALADFVATDILEGV